MNRLIASICAAVAVVWIGCAAQALAQAPGRMTTEGFSDLAERLMPAVVNIATTQRIDGVGQPPRARGGKGGQFDDLFGDENLNEVSSLGSGFIVSAAGNIVTNNHVIEGADQIGRAHV